MKKQAGFTLIEFSMVILIIALISGSVVVGRSMLRASEVRAVVAEVAGFTQALVDFRDKYKALPGDFNGAEALWGSDGTCPTTTYTSAPHKATCNGNGDGLIGNGTNYEVYRAWQQLANAGLVNGAFNGIAGSGGALHSQIGINVPESKLSGAGYTLLYVVFDGSGNNWPEAAHQLNFGVPMTNAHTYGAVLTPAEAFEIDTKMDDGNPAYGTVLTAKSALYPNCNTSDTQTSSQYNASYAGIACGLIFTLGL